MTYRLTTRRATALAAATLCAAGAAVAVTTAPADAATSAFGAHFSAPYLQLSDDTVGDIAKDLAATGTNTFTLAFVTPKSGCTGIWEASGGGVGAYRSQVAALQAKGGDVAISFGGAQGGELAQTCTNVAQLENAYASFVTTYGVTRLDFDVEGGVLADTAATARGDQAIAALQRDHPSVKVDFTLGVGPDGLPGGQQALLRDARAKGVRTDVVNLMTMDFGDGENALADAKSAAVASAKQVQGIFGVGLAAAWHKLGLTPIAGQNDDQEFFSHANASTLEKFAAAHNVRELSFWELDYYDRPTGYAYSRIFRALV